VSIAQKYTTNDIAIPFPMDDSSYQPLLDALVHAVPCLRTCPASVAEEELSGLLEARLDQLTLSSAVMSAPDSSSLAAAATETKPASATPVEPESSPFADPQECDAYAPEILTYWRASEDRRAPNPEYMNRQTDINAKMREILVDLMVEVQLKFKLKQETLFLSVHILDRFLERRAVTRTKLQLVGCTALLLAAKYEEIYAPEVSDFISISDKVYSREQILAMEGIMLNALGFNLTVPLPLNFLQAFSKLAAVQQGSQTWFMAEYFLEITLQTYAFLRYKPSQLAASALWLAMSTAAQSQLAWSATIEGATEYTTAQLKEPVTEMHQAIVCNENGTSKYKAVKKKYSLPRFENVARNQCFVPTFA
jgi:hypothetical protein